ncbi:MAG: type VI secretion system contractile sheath domain-containing protein, partial [Planctomyces sp.]
MSQADITRQSAAGETLESSDFAQLLNKEFKPKTDKAKEAIAGAVRTLAEQALQNVSMVSDDVLKSIESLIAASDRKLTEQVTLVLHNDEFQKLEGAWRGLHHLVTHTETDEFLKIRVMNISKKEL